MFLNNLIAGRSGIKVVGVDWDLILWNLRFLSKSMIEFVQLQDAHFSLVPLYHFQHVQIPLVISGLLVLQEGPDVGLEFIGPDYRKGFRNELGQVDQFIQLQILVQMHE